MPSGYSLYSFGRYTTFGSPMPSRSFSASNYRYGFNGKEKDDEVAGNGNINTAMFWEYDTRLGRRWNIDPEFKQFPNESPYVAFHNNPILFSDIHGDTIKVGDNMRNNPQSMAGFNAFKNSNAGKNFFKKYDVGGKYEKVTVTFDDASAEQMTQYFSDATDGVTITAGLSTLYFLHTKSIGAGVCISAYTVERIFFLKSFGFLSRSITNASVRDTN